MGQALKLERGRRATLTVPRTAAGNGIAKIGMSLKSPKAGSDAVEITRTFKLGIVPGTVSTVQRIIRQIEPGASMTLSRDIVSDILPGIGTVTLSVSTMSALDVPGLLQRLDRYPYGCTEQLVSRALPLVYLNSLAASEALAADEGIEELIRTTIERVLSRQGSNGSFGLWSAGGGSYWLDAFVVDFLTRAREARYAVPDKAFSLSLDRLRNCVANTTNVDQNSTELAYAAYILARNDRPVMGDLRYLADTKLGSFRTPLARGQIAAALALLGDGSRSQATLDSAVELLKSQREDSIYRGDYGSKLRDGAGLLALSAEAGAGAGAARIAALSQVVDEERTSRPYTSTQENTWMVLVAQALAKDSDALTLTIDGVEKKGALYLTLAPYGGNLEGARAASLAYFGREPKRLSFSEAALLVALPQAPETRRPDRHAEAALKARNRVIDRAVAAGIIERAAGESAKADPVPKLRSAFPVIAAHAAESAVAENPEQNTHRLTLDRNLQVSLEALAREAAESTGPRVSAAIVVIDNSTGELLASVGSPDYLSTLRNGARHNQGHSLSGV